MKPEIFIRLAVASAKIYDEISGRSSHSFGKKRVSAFEMCPKGYATNPSVCIFVLLPVCMDANTRFCDTLGDA